MLKMLVWKESRELLPLVVLAFVGQGLYLLSTRVSYFGTYNDQGVIPFIDDWLPTWMLVIGSVAAVGLGFWQISAELSRGTFLFLLHRPVDRTAIFTIKLLVGIGLTLLIAGLPLLGYSWWAASPGTHASPFFWSMTTGMWLGWFGVPLFYLGAFLSGLRPGRWLGSRAFPLGASLLAFVMVFALGFWPVIALVATLLLEACFLLCICFVAATRDFS